MSTTTPATLFLDLDDVLCLNDTYTGYDVIDALQERHRDPGAVFRGVFNPRACQVLHQLHAALDGNLRYVISSTWRKHIPLAQLRQVFQAAGLGFAADAVHEAWCTPDAIHPGLRATDIALWMTIWHRSEPFAIIDDTFSGASLEPALIDPVHPFHGRVVLCDERVGLLPGHLEPLVRALRMPFAGSPAPLGFASQAGLPQRAVPSPACVAATRYVRPEGGASARG